MMYVNNLKEFDRQNKTDYYGVRLDQKAEKLIFPYIGSKVWNDAKRIALLNIPQSIHRLPYKRLVGLLDSDTQLTCLDISNIVTCMQQLTVAHFNTDDEYLIFLKENSRVIETLQEFYAGFDAKIELDLEKEMQKEKSKPKILTLNGLPN